MKKTLLSAAFLIVFSSFSFAQYGEYVEPVLIDEFPRLAHCDLLARTDALFISLQQRTHGADAGKTPGVIIFYRRLDQLPGARAVDPSIVRTIKEHIKMRKFDSDLVTFIDGGFRQAESYEFWLVPKGAAPPYPKDTLPKPEIPEETTFLWDRSILDYDFGVLETKQFILDYYAEIESEEQDFEALPFANEDETQESAIDKYRWANRLFGEFLKRNRNRIGVVIYYFDDEKFDAEKVRSELKIGIKLIAEESGIDPGRIELFAGGYREGVEAEFWILNTAEDYPTATPAERPAYVYEPEEYDVSID